MYLGDMTELMAQAQGMNREEWWNEHVGRAATFFPAAVERESRRGAAVAGKAQPSAPVSASTARDAAGRLNKTTKAGTQFKPTRPSIPKPKPTQPQTWPAPKPGQVAQVILPKLPTKAQAPSLYEKAAEVAKKSPEVAKAIKTALETVATTGRAVGVNIQYKGDLWFRIVLQPAGLTTGLSGLGTAPDQIIRVSRGDLTAHYGNLTRLPETPGWGM